MTFIKRTCAVIALCFLVVLCAGCPKSNIAVVEAVDVALPEVPAPKQDITEDINGYKISDPYRWLEDANKAETWVEAQNARALKYFDSVKIPGMGEQLSKLYDIGYVSDPQIAGGWIFYRKRLAGAEQPTLNMRKGKTEHILIDPMKVDDTGKTALDWYKPSVTGKYLAYGLSKDGSEMSTLYILDVAAKKDLAVKIPNTRWSSIAWLPDDSGLFFTFYPNGGQYDRHVYYYKLGDDAKQVEYIFGKGRKKTDWPYISLSADGKSLFLNVSTGATTNDCYLMDVATRKITTIAENIDAHFSAVDFYKGRLLGMTTKDSPNWRLVSVDPKNPKGPWKDVIAERENPLNGVDIVGNKMIALYKETAVSKLRMFDMGGKEIGQIKLPTFGSISDTDSEPGSDKMVFAFSSFLYPPSLFTVDADTSLDARPFEMTPVGDAFSPEDYEVKYVEYPSYDGERIPLFIASKKGAKKDGSNRTILRGYGGFAISYGPYFSRSTLFWIQRGGMIAVAGLRGGSEKGERWHEAGMLEKKFQVFEDFEYAMRYLIREGYTQPDRLGIQGGSNGGLLMGAMITRVPYLFNCSLAHVGLYDMVRYHKFPPAQLWVPEYGSADNPEQTGYIWAYSPYHQVLPGIAYPATFVQTAESDTRVHWLHSAKFAAMLQSTGDSKGPIIFYLQRKAGHGQGMNWSDAVKEGVQTYSFAIDQLGDPAKED